MSQNKKFALAFVIVFFTSILVTIPVGIWALNTTIIWAFLVTYIFISAYLYLTIKQVDVAIYGSNGKKKQAKASSSLLFIIKITLIFIPAILFGVLRANGIWESAIWGTIIALASMPIGMLIFRTMNLKLLHKTKEQKIQILKDLKAERETQGQSPSDDDAYKSKYAQKFVNKLEEKRKEGN